MKMFTFLSVLFLGLLVKGRWIKGSSEENPDTEALYSCFMGEGLANQTYKISSIMNRDQYPTEDQDFNRFFGCYYSKRYLIDTNGNIQLENLKVFFQNLFVESGKATALLKLLAQTVVNECKETQGENVGQKAVKTHNCIMSVLNHFEDYEISLRKL